MVDALGELRHTGNRSKGNQCHDQGIFDKVLASSHTTKLRALKCRVVISLFICSLLFFRAAELASPEKSRF